MSTHAPSATHVPRRQAGNVTMRRNAVLIGCDVLSHVGTISGGVGGTPSGRWVIPERRYARPHEPRDH